MNQEDYQNQIDKWLQNVDGWTIKKIWQVVSALNSAWQLEGQDNFKIPHEKFERARSTSKEDLMSILSNLHRREIIQVIRKLGETPPSDDPSKPKASVWITITEKPDIINQDDTQVRIMPKKFGYLVETLKVLVTQEQLPVKQNQTVNPLERFEWLDKFHWLNEKQFYLDDSKVIEFDSHNSDRIKVFRILTEAKGNWVKVSEMAKAIYGNNNHKLHHKIRVIIRQLNKEKCSKDNVIKIIPLDETDAGAYRIKVLA